MKTCLMCRGGSTGLFLAHVLHEEQALDGLVVRTPEKQA